MKKESFQTSGKSPTLAGGAATRRYVLRKQIQPDPHQPRKDFDKAKLQELADSFGGSVEGILETLKVREEKDGFVLIDGERRWRAAELAGLDRLPIEVIAPKDLTKAQYTFGTQRENLTALEEAHTLDRMLKERQAKDPKFTPLQLATELGRKKSTVYELLGLVKVSAPVMKALRAGEINPSQAMRIAAVPAPEAQAQIVEEIKEAEDYGERMNVEDVEDLIRRDHCLNLKDAPFNIKQDFKLPCGITKELPGGLAASNCDVCPHRSGNKPNWPDSKSSLMCLLPACYRVKVVVDAKMKGHPAITPEEYEKAKGKYLEGSRHEHRGNKGYCSAIEAMGKFAPPPVLTLDEGGRVIKLYPRAEALEAMKKNGLKKEERESGPSAEDRARQEQREKAAALVARQCMAKIESAAGKGTPAERKFWQLIFSRPDVECGFEAAEELAVLMELVPRTKTYLGNGWLRKATEKFTCGQYRAFLAAVSCANFDGTFSGVSSGYDEGLKKLCELAGLDWKKATAAAERSVPDPAKVIDQKALQLITAGKVKADSAEFKAAVANATVATLQAALSNPRGIAPVAYTAVAARVKVLRPEPTAKAQTPTATKTKGKKK